MTWRGRGLRPILGPATWGRLQWLSRPMGGAGGSSGHSCASVCFKEEDMASRLFIHSCRWRYEEFELRYQHRHFFFGKIVLLSFSDVFRYRFQWLRLYCHSFMWIIADILYTNCIKQSTPLRVLFYYSLQRFAVWISYNLYIYTTPTSLIIVSSIVS